MNIPDDIIAFELSTGREPADEKEKQPAAFIRILLRKIRDKEYTIEGPLAEWLENNLNKNLEEVIIFLLRCENTTAPQSPESI
jgi:hypothetical protein